MTARLPFLAACGAAAAAAVAGGCRRSEPAGPAPVALPSGAGGAGTIGTSAGTGGAAATAMAGAGGALVALAALAAPVVAGGPAWASWPVPHPPSTGLPHPASYDIDPKGVVVDQVTGLMWQRTVDPRSFTWGEARDYCRRLDLADHDDWRLPSRIELVSIVDLTHSQPSIDQHVFPRTPSDWFWTSSVDADNPGGAAWYVYFYFGYPKTDPMATAYRARCVRAADGGKPPRFVAAPPYDVQKEIVRDRGTGLTWQRAVPGRDVTFEDARRYCAGLRLGREKGWRVPSMGELLTLVDERASGPTIDAQAFPGTPAKSFWTSSLFADTPRMAWHVYFQYGNALYGLLTGTYAVRCVR